MSNPTDASPGAPFGLGTGAGGSPGSSAAPAVLVPGLLVLMTLAILVSGALTPRDLSVGEDAAIYNTSELAVFDLSRAVTALVLFSSLATIVRALIRRGLPRAGLSVWLSYMTFVLLNFALPALTGRVPVFDHRLLLPSVVFTAVYFAQPMTDHDLLALGKGVFLAFVYASLAAAVVAPAQALAAGYVGLIPGLDDRLYGIGGGATSLGTISSSYLAIEIVSPSRSRLRYLHLAAAAFALLLTQSKTSWLFVLAVVLYTWLRRRRRRLPSVGLGAGASTKAAKALLLACAAAALAAAAALYVARMDLSAVRGGENLMTFTGRTYVWAVTLKLWLDDPIFGYGLDLWRSEGFRLQHGGFDHSHNQFFHALGSAGVVGLAGLLLYLAAAVRCCLRAARTHPAPLVLLAGLLVLCLTNVPLLGFYLLDAFVVLHLFMFALLIQAERRLAA